MNVQEKNSGNIMSQYFSIILKNVYVIIANKKMWNFICNLQ